jgi:signal transduction histidine kinase
MFSEKYQIWGLIILIILLFVIGAFISIVFILYQKKFHFNKKLLKVESDYQENMLLTQLEIQEQTFQQISREIHDHIGQRLTLARLYINSLLESINITQIDALKESSNLIEEAIGDLKHLSRSLTANIIRDEGLLQALKLEVERVSKITSLRIEMDYGDNLPFLSLENELIIYRIIQEAIQNIIKHAKATHVNISLSFSNRVLLLEIRDNGKGFDLSAFRSAPTSHKSGLDNLKKRAALLQGELNINSEEGKGTSLQFKFPNQQHLNTYATN